MNPVLIAVLAVALTLATPGLSAAAPEGDRRHLEPQWSELKDDLLELQEHHRVPALALVILDRARPVLILANALDGAKPFDRHSPFRWGSISKSVTALATLEAARRQRVDLETPVADLLARRPFQNPWAPAAPVRLAHLLELSAGLPDLTPEEFRDNTPRPLAEALARNADRRLVLWPPGLQHGYTNVAPGITSAVLERLTGMPFDAAVRELVFSPLGMEQATFLRVASLPGGFRADGRTEIPYWHVTFPAFGGLNASPAALARLLEALLRGGRVDGGRGVARSSIDRMFRIETTLGAARGLEIGYGAGLYGWVRDGHLFHGHGGDADGYRSRLGLLRHARRGYLVGINVDDPVLLRRIRHLVEQALTSDLEPLPPPPPVAVPAAELSGYAGTYYPSSSRFAVGPWQAGEAETAQICRDGAGLTFSWRTRTTRLVPLGNGRFRRAEDPAVSVVFGEHSGALHVQGELGNFVRLDSSRCPAYLPVCGVP